MDPILFIQDLFVILLSAAVAGIICRGIGISPVLGYLIVGLIMGTPEIVFPYVTDEERLEALSQLGLVFLMFSIGLRFRLEKIKVLGIRLILSTFLTALALFSLLRWGALVLGQSPEAAFCLAAIFLCSSSAIIGKILQERRLSHERFGQIALGMTLMEDIVAVVILAILGSLLVGGSGTGGVGIVGTVGLVVGFAVLLVVLGLIFLTRLADWVRNYAGGEVLMILVVGTVLGSALLASKAGYSLALGAFLSGLILAESRPRVEIERNFTGMRDVFLTIFFVVIGMQVELQSLPAVWHWIVLGTVVAILGRSITVYLTLLLVCEKPRTALGAALLLTPLGEFSFIIAALGISAGILPASFQGIAVGIAVGTTFLSPLLASQRDRIAQWLGLSKEPSRQMESYRNFWQSFGRVAENHRLWLIIRHRLVQIAFEVILVSSLLVFSQPLGEWISRVSGVGGDNWLSPVILGSVLLITTPLIYAVIRNLHAVSWITLEYLEKIHPDLRQVSPIIRPVAVTLIMSVLFLWWWNLLPAITGVYWILPAYLVILLLLGVIFRRKMVLVHSQFRDALETTLQDEESTLAKVRKSLPTESWGVKLEEVILPDDTIWAGKTIAATGLREQTGVSIVGLERQGFALSTISPQGHLFPGDQLLLLGQPEGLAKACSRLSETQDRTSTEALQSITLESVLVEKGSSAEGQELISLRWPAKFRVQVVGQEREGKKTANPEARSQLRAGDQLLLMGNLADLNQVRKECTTPVQPGEEEKKP